MSPDELLNLIIKRRSIRKWLDKPVEEEKVSKILTAGIYAPSAANCQKVKFFVIQDKEMINVVCNNTSDWFKKIFPNKIILVLFYLAKNSDNEDIAVWLNSEFFAQAFAALFEKAVEGK